MIQSSLDPFNKLLYKISQDFLDIEYEKDVIIPFYAIIIVKIIKKEKFYFKSLYITFMCNKPYLLVNNL